MHYDSKKKELIGDMDFMTPEEDAFESILRKMGYPSAIEFDTSDDGERRRFYAYWRKRMDELGKERR